MRRHLFKARIILFAVAIALVTYRLGFAQGLHIVQNLVDFIVIISAIVFVHEFGHYIIAKWCGVKIEVFSIGFGRELLGWNDRSGTRWKISMLPFGGYVRMYGDTSETSTVAATADMTDEQKALTFHHKPLYKKAAIVVAGPLANFLMTITILTVFIVAYGIPSTEPVIGEIIKDTPAEAAGLKPGDRVLSVNGEKVEVFFDIPRMIMLNLGTPVELTLQRGDTRMDVTLTPKQITEKDGLGNNYTHPVIGFKSTEIKYTDVGPVQAVWEATRATYSMCTMTLQAIFQMVTGERSATDNIKGPLSIAKLSGQATDKGFYAVFRFMALLSANLGLINLFPIPMLDGGHLLYYAIEAAQGKPLAKRFQDYGLRIGMAMIAMLMAFAIINDLRGLLLS